MEDRMVKDTMDELIRQKREIEEKIKALKEESERFGKVKLSVQRDNPNRPQCTISLMIPHYYIGERRARWSKIIDGETVSEAVAKLPELIADLQRMYDYYNQKEGSGA